MVFWNHFSLFFGHNLQSARQKIVRHKLARKSQLIIIIKAYQPALELYYIFEPIYVSQILDAWTASHVVLVFSNCYWFYLLIGWKWHIVVEMLLWPSGTVPFWGFSTNEKKRFIFPHGHRRLRELFIMQLRSNMTSYM